MCYPIRRRNIAALTGVMLIAVLAAGCAATPESGNGFAGGPQPSLPPSAEGLLPGLAVLYFKHNFVRHMDSLPEGEAARERGWSGAPVPYLNHHFGRGEVFESGTNRGIAMEMRGFIRLEQPGTYLFQANSNDGFRLYIDGRLLIDDPSWHSDRLSPETRLTVPEPGWYSLRVRYFQRKGTATLQLFWRPPGRETFSTVPAAVLAHREPY